MADEKKVDESTDIVELQEFEVELWVDGLKDFKDIFVYSFKQGGRVVTGLTARAIEELCLINNPKVSIIASNVERTEDEVVATATAQAIYITPTTKTTNPDGTVVEVEGYQEVIQADGIRVEPTTVGGRKDPHVEMKALTKAMRAARRQLISQEMQVEAKQSLLALQGGKPVQVPQQAIEQNTQQQQAPPKETAHERARKAMFAKFGEVKDSFAKQGITSDMFWDSVKKQYEVESSNDMTVVQFQELRAHLDATPFGSVVQTILQRIADNLDEKSRGNADESDDINVGESS